MEPNKLIKDKNKLLMAIPVILGILFLYVFFIREDGNVPSGSDRQAASQAFLEPQSEMADKVNDKMEAYKQDKLEEQEKARILKESQVKGSDFYFELQNQQERYDRATLERIRRMQNDPYSEVMAEYGGGRNGRFSHQLESQLDGLEDEQALNEIIREAKKNSRIRKELEESDKYRKRMYERIVNYDQEGKTEKAAANPSGHPSADSLMQKGPIYHAENGKRVRRQPTSAPGNSNLFRACIHGDQTVVTGSTVRMRLLQDVTLSGMKIPANTLFYGIATLGANRLDVVVSNLKVGDNLNPVSVVVFDNDAMEGLNLPNNLKASAAKRMEQGLVQNIDMPLSSIGTMASEVTSVVNATTQVAKQILNMSLSQVKVHLKSNYEMYIQEESQESKLRRQALQAELQKLYEQMEQEKTNKKNKDVQKFNKKQYKSYKFGYGEMKYPFIEYMSYKLKKTDKDNYEYTEALEDAVEKMGTNINDVIKKEHFGIAIKKVLMGNCITTLKNISRIDFQEIFERINGVEEILKMDPAEVYNKMDYKTKAYYRGKIKELAKKTKKCAK